MRRGWGWGTSDLWGEVLIRAASRQKDVSTRPMQMP